MSHSPMIACAYDLRGRGGRGPAPLFLAVPMTWMRTEPGQGDTPARRGHPLTLGLAERHELVELWEAGDHTVADLARTFGVSAQTILTTYRHESSCHLPGGRARQVRAPKLDQEQRRQLVALWGPEISRWFR